MHACVLTCIARKHDSHLTVTAKPWHQWEGLGTGDPGSVSLAGAAGPMHTRCSPVQLPLAHTALQPKTTPMLLGQALSLLAGGAWVTSAQW